MNAVRFHGKEDLRFEQIPEPECGKGQVKIKPAWCGICGRVCTRQKSQQVWYRHANLIVQFVASQL